MPKQSAGLLLFRTRNDVLEFLLVHPGGLFWKNKDAGAWSIPKGEYSPGEDPLETAVRELEEETGQTVRGSFIKLRPIRQAGGKVGQAFAIEWPPRSGQKRIIPEVDRAEWFDLPTAAEKINAAQAPLLHELQKKIADDQSD
jgi:predicted NUDIX family NTP pyrophosphohydrolase